jgi:ADP-ribose pyrophosphatase YjhB (NUDIX family)
MNELPFKAKLSEIEIQDLVKLLEKVHIPAPYPVFLAFCKAVPLVAIDIAVMPDPDHILLTYRKDEFYDNWHIPGSILWYGEDPLKALHRVAEKELGARVAHAEFLHYFNEFTPREQSLMLLFKVALKEEPKQGTYFPLNELPSSLMKEEWGEINFLKSLREKKNENEK